MKRTVLGALLLAVFASVAAPATAPAAAPDDASTPETPVASTSPVIACRATNDGYEAVTLPANLEVAQDRIDQYRDQGARWPGEEVPGVQGPGRYLDEDCEEVSWLLGVSFAGCAAAAEGATPCDPATVGDGGAGGLFASDTAVVQDPGIEFASVDEAVQADFDGDYLTLTVAPGLPEMQFVFDFGDWQIWDHSQTGNPTLDVLETEEATRQFGVTTASTEGATEPQTVTYRMVLEHSAGLSPFRNSTIALDPVEVAADGESTTEVTLELLDVLGEAPDEERVVELFMNEQFGTIGPVTYLGDGLYTATVTVGAAPGTGRIVAMVDYLDLDLTSGALVLTPVGPEELDTLGEPEPHPAQPDADGTEHDD